ncbi:hypothetical protein QWE_00060 [Agrobacterium albertimagni AOL15]|uniref:Uncharacterized protein n=1 Tax=Agrobacterium albertimagni AOL15 TaxID=1156935 RepID=K2Q8L5_9HYPH|nr:hypothetical protein [Agrobacterium albertimagni]EKF61550.1 hypothetical protein QWE_00060 [Agrobacterium albertimagni AOL15]
MFERFKGFLRRDRNPDIVELQESAVKSVAGDIVDLQDGEWHDREWVYIAVNHEVLAEEGERSSTQARVLAQKPGGELENLGFRLSQSTKLKLLVLRDAMANRGANRWTVLDLTIERSGHYDFSFSYTPPPRLNGDLLHAPLSNLLERYINQRGER